jgi:hypothetical protein
VVAAIEPELYAAEYLRSRRSSPENLDAFTEGFDTPDLKEAKALLDQLTEPAIAAEG